MNAGIARQALRRFRGNAHGRVVYLYLAGVEFPESGIDLRQEHQGVPPDEVKRCLGM